jgi:SAM-dependent methyltransferase
MRSEPQRYFAGKFASDGEQDRLAVLEGNYDPGTFRLLEDVGVEVGWRCAEVGAGRGSVAAWLADAVGPDGSVVAFDIDTSHLDHLTSRPNAEVRCHDIVAAPIGDAKFDLVHARLVIEHLPEPERLLEMLATATRPGGVLVVESTDMLATAAADPSDSRSRAFDEFMARSFAAVGSMSTFDVGFARRLPRLFDALGFIAQGSQVVGRIARGGDSKALEYALPVREAMRSSLIESGHATADSIDEYLATLADPSFWFVANNVVAAWGHRPT